MRPYQKVDGQVLLSAREYDIAKDTVILVGQVVCLAAGLVVLASAAQSGAILGIAAENHRGVNDPLDPRSDGERIKVFDDPAMVMQCHAPRFTATGGTATTITATTLGAFANGDFNGGYIKLVKKAEGSANTDAIGTVKRISAYAYNSSGTVSTFTVAEGSIANAGDEYELFPPIGFKKGNLDADREKLVLSATANLSLKVVGHDRIQGCINMMANTHVLGVEE